MSTNGPRPTTMSGMKSRLTVRLEMFEVYENHKGKFSLLMVTSDPTEAHRIAEAGDAIVQRWWVREGSDE